MEYIHTDEKVEVLDYPYGYTLRTTLYDSIMFTKRGFKYRKQTINPYTKELNKPKITTYSFFMVRYYDEKYHIKVIAVDSIDKREDLLKVVEQLRKAYDMFEEKHHKYFITEILACIKVDMRSVSIINRIPIEVLEPIYNDAIEVLEGDIKNKTLKYIKYDFSGLYDKVEQIIKSNSK